jgi:hypothetical protein
MPIQLATLLLATLQLATFQLATFQLATLQLATMTTRHYCVYAWIILSILIIFYFNVCTVLLPEFFIQYLADFYC